MRLAVVGCRYFTDYDIIKRELDKYENIELIVSGGADGVDKLAEKYAEEHNIKTMIFLPEWSKYGRAAGPIRNKLIIENCDNVIAFWDGKTPGTKSSVNIAKKLNKNLNIYYF